VDCGQSTIIHSNSNKSKFTFEIADNHINNLPIASYTPFPMKKLSFKTNIQCGNCLSKVTPKLNEQPGIHSWAVDLQDPNKTLTVETEALNPEDIQKAVLKAGFIATLM
jgi:copper chaperone